MISCLSTTNIQETEETLNTLHDKYGVHELEKTDLLMISRSGKATTLHIQDAFDESFKVENGRICLVNTMDKIRKEFFAFKNVMLAEIVKINSDWEDLKREIEAIKKLIDTNKIIVTTEINGVKEKLGHFVNEEDKKEAFFSSLTKKQYSDIEKINEKIDSNFQNFNSRVDSLNSAIKFFAKGSELINFSPIISGMTTQGIACYTQQIGMSQIIGNQCLINICMGWIDHTGTGELIISNFPDMKFMCEQLGMVELFLNDRLIKNCKVVSNIDSKNIRFSSVNENDEIHPVLVKKSGVLKVSLHCFIGD